MSYVEARRKHAKELSKFLKKIGFKDVNGGDDFIVGGHQVPACAGHESSLLILECTTQKDINSKIKTFRGKIPSINHGFRLHKTYKQYKRYIPILAVKHQKVTEKHLDYATKNKGPRIHIWDNNFVSYYSKLTSTIDKYARYNLLSEIGVKPDIKEKVTIPALLTQVGVKKRFTLFLFFIEADNLLKMSYVARRELGNEYFYQRMVKSPRLREIAEYVKKGKVFPNSIIVSLDKGSYDFHPISQKNKKMMNVNFPNWIEFGTMELVNNYRSCWIIDGQHRLYSYARLTGRGIVAVSAFARLTEEAQADYFLDINREAKPVSPDLLWDLRGSLSPNSTRGIISNSVKDLNGIKGGFFKDNIKIPSLGGKGKFRFNNICTSIEKNGLAEQLLPHLHKNKKNPFWNSNYQTFVSNISQGINQYFSCINEGLSKEKFEIYSDGFISVMISLLRLLVTHLNKKPSLDLERSFFKPIWKFLDESNNNDINNIKKSLSSEAGKTEFRNFLINIIQDGYDPHFALGIIIKEKSLAEKIKELEFQLNEFVNSILEEEIGPNWIKEQKYFTDSAQRNQCLKLAKLNKRPPWEFINFQTMVTNIIMNKDLWPRLFEKIFISSELFSTKDQLQILTQELWNYRSNMLGHKRSKPVTYSKDKESIIRSSYNIFISIIGGEIE